MKRVKKSEDTTTFSGYLVLSENGMMKVARHRPTLNGGEIACILEVTVPANIFDFAYPTIKLTIDDAAILHAPYEARAKHLLDKV